MNSLIGLLNGKINGVIVLVISVVKNDKEGLKFDLRSSGCTASAYRAYPENLGRLLLSSSLIVTFQAYFNAPQGNEPLALDLGSMGKGQVWINGQSIGRYWTAYAKGECHECSYTGTYRQANCQYGCGKPTQRWYRHFLMHV